MIVIKRGGRRFGTVCNYWSADSTHCDMPPPSHPCHASPSSVNSIGTSQTPHHSRHSHHTEHFEAQAWAPCSLSLSTRPLPSLGSRGMQSLQLLMYKQQCSSSYDDVSGAATGQGITNLFGRLAVVSTCVCSQFTALRFWVDVGVS